MYFKKLELVGFKSFFDKTTLNFEPGITAIVGPNGCGKSNIFDAIRWVLGEQSVKSLRGYEMQDVIFNGTDSKEPLSMAEVSLAFDNNNGFFAVDQGEVIISRRIFRSGESEYLLNKTPVRLKDILDLFMGTGIGAESYSLVEQGKIDLILSAKPEDRRLVFDEAAGITKYKAHKKEALRKLEEAEQNLLRVNDIIAEVKRQIGSLERQANRARRYKEIFEELKLKEINFAVLKKNELMGEKDNSLNQLNALEVSEDELLSVIQEHGSKISNYRNGLKTLEDTIMAFRKQALSLDNLILANKERISFDKEKIVELETNQKYLKAQTEQIKNRLTLDEEKLNNLKDERSHINRDIETKGLLLKKKEARLSQLVSSIKTSLENIGRAKRNILELVTKSAQVKNEIADLTSKQQIYLARKKRLEVEKAKVCEEKAEISSALENLNAELKELQIHFNELNLKISNAKAQLGQEGLSLDNLNSDIDNLEKEKLALLSHREFLDKLKTKYEDIGESMNAVIYLDRPPQDRITGLVVKIKDSPHLTDADRQKQGFTEFKLSGEAKPIDLDVQKINAKIESIEQKMRALEEAKKVKETRIGELNASVHSLKENLRNQEIILANKKTSHQAIREQFNKINEEEEIMAMELSDVTAELSVSEEKIATIRVELAGLEKEQKESEAIISNEQNNINLSNTAKEETLVVTTQIKTELDGLAQRLDSDRATLKILEGTYQQDREGLLNLEKQMEDNAAKQEYLISEIKNLEHKAQELQEDIQNQDKELKKREGEYQEISKGLSDAALKLEADRKGIDILKNKLYELQVAGKDIDFKITSIKERILQAYKVDLDTFCDIAPQADKNMLAQDIQKLKEKLDACGTVNLVAIEEYDELKKRYDFLTQQQNDLVASREALNEAIQKINRTTKKMFLETFEQIRQEFRNYFKLLFNGGDVQVFLVDEQDPLESGIEIICRPPGKKLQNVLLLSGGEKSLSAIALIFAIFKIKPSPFCVLDEIDAALDEANVDRFSRILQEFAKESQFIVITHNKKTIVNASVMYGITMQESGVSKIVSVKFAEKKALGDKEPAVAVAQPV